MTNGNSQQEDVSDSESREVWALKQALEFLGFDVDALVQRMCESRESYWQRLALRSTSISFDVARAHAIEPCLSSAILFEAESWLTSVRLASPNAPLRSESFAASSAREPRGGGQP